MRWLRRQDGFYVFIPHDRELRPLLLRAVEAVVDVIEADGIAVVANGDDVDTLAWSEADGPVVAWHARDDVVVGERPAGSDVAILNPDVRILVGERHFGDSILNEDGGMGLAVVMHDLSLVADHILQGDHRGDHLARRTEMIELAPAKRHDGHGELVQLWVVELWVGAQGAAELGVEVVVVEVRSEK